MTDMFRAFGAFACVCTLRSWGAGSDVNTPLGVDGPAFGRLRETLQSAESVTLRKQPLLAKATANLSSLRDELYMTDSQVRPMRGRANAGYARSLHDQCGVKWLLDMCSGLPIAARCVSGRRWLA